MSWLRTAVNKAVEVGNRKNITRTVRNYADSVVQQAGQAVAEGAKLLQDRIGAGAFKSVNQTIQRLEEAAVSYRGHERALLITRWLSVLKEIDKATQSDKQMTSEELLASNEAKRREWVLYYDPDIGGEPLNFRDVFLQSQALEGIVLSMIIEPPHDDEITLLLEMFGLCLNGAKEVHDAIVSSMQDLATVFSSYKDEVLELGAEIAQLEKQRDELEAELKKVNISLAAAQARFRNATEERDQFGEANNQIIAHLKTKEDDLSKSVVACKKEAEVIKTWINFLEDTWLLRCSYTETKDKQTLSEMPPSADQGDNQVSDPRKSLEMEYLDYETKIITTFSIVDNMKEHFQALQSKLEKKDDRRVKELFDDMEKMRQQFESIARPTLEIETPSPKSSASTPKSPSPSTSMDAPVESTTPTQKPELSNPPKAPLTAAGSSQEFNPEAELAELESEFGKVARDYSADEVDGWEFDELEKELQ
ncbi:unnamed protein product [Microthlaspi erraticum]|uniref:Uncharacterized protein n=1 Tax=Microthlaspi erraticum TaxID=1685480 RepID=A0A6D2J292_9BRAS|nr:unnamed protein product [Microthlaspi erraticum]